MIPVILPGQGIGETICLDGLKKNHEVDSRIKKLRKEVFQIEQLPQKQNLKIWRDKMELLTKYPLPATIVGKNYFDAKGQYALWKA